jgi:hypothetical protein
MSWFRFFGLGKMLPGKDTIFNERGKKISHELRKNRARLAFLRMFGLDYLH